MFEAVILAGGVGTRLKSISGNIPKPMVEINGIPFLYRLLGLLEKSGCSRVVLSLGYEAQYIIDRLNFDKPVNIEIDWVVEDHPLGTGGAIKLAASKIYGNSFIVLNGDTFLDIDYSIFFQAANSAELLISAISVKDVSRYGSLELATDNTIINFKEKNDRGSGVINSGTYVIKRVDILCYPKTKFSFESDFLPEYEKKIHAFVTKGYFIDIGIPEDFRKAETDLL